LFCRSRTAKKATGNREHQSRHCARSISFSLPYGRQKAHNPSHMKTNIASVVLILLFVHLAPLPTAQAVVPPPDGGYPNLNTAEGTNALLTLTTGAANTAVGWSSLRSVTIGGFNTGVGAGTLFLNTADANTALGAAALLFNTTGDDNTAVGAAALLNNGDGASNTALGSFALRSNTVGNANTAVGRLALFDNIDGLGNTACGDSALVNNQIGNGNTAMGQRALTENISGGNNTALGLFAGSQITGSNNVAIGANALSESAGSDNIAVGASAGSGVAGANNVICIGDAGDNVNNSCFIGHIRGVPTAQNNAIAVLIDSSGQLGTVSSSRRYKKEIKPMDKASEAILALKPVTFHYKTDKMDRPEFGLIAEEVAEVNPNLVVHDENGEIYTVRYDAVNAMLLNEFLKARRQIDAQQKQIEALTVGLQKVSAQLATASPSLADLN
jgi:Chaperone of endosialidase